MHIQEHKAKAARIARTIAERLHPDQDYELYVEGFMLAGTHLLNGMLHRLGILPPDCDLLHSAKPVVRADYPAEVEEVRRLMREIEDLREGYLRGQVPWNPHHARLCAENYARVQHLAAL